MSRPLSTIASLWYTGLRAGLTTLPRDPVLGLKRVVLPVSYWRAAEFAFTARELDCVAGAAVLDLGSPKDLALFLACRRNYAMTAVDILPDTIAISDRFAKAHRRLGDGPGQVRSEVQDGRALPYPDCSFDAAFSVSVIEHIPDSGDSSAIRELLRVVRPGGKVILTVPYARKYRETFVRGRVYEREADELNFFERHYDDDALQRRLIKAADATLERLEIWGEGRVRGERLLASLGPARILASPFEGAMASLLLRQTSSPADHAMAAFMTLRKPVA